MLSSIYFTFALVGPLQLNFVDTTQPAGLNHLQRETVRDCFVLSPENGCEMEFMSGGVAVGDINSDGWPDIYMTRLDGPDSMFLNRRDGTFIEIADRVGLGANLQSNGAAFGDIDNDGDQDLFITVIGDSGDPINNRHRLYVNNGQGRFSEEGLERGASLLGPGRINGWSVSFGDYDRDGWIDLHVTQWAKEEFSRARLLRNRGTVAPGTFEDMTEVAGVEIAEVFAFATTLVDLDDDGWQDLAVAGDFFTSRLFWNNGDGTFVNGTNAAGVGTDENGMGSTFGDYDGDGDLDWFVSSIYDPLATCSTGFCNWQNSGNRLYRNEGGRLFSDATDQAGVRDGGWGWGSSFLDLDNDGDQDLLSVNGVRFSTILAAQFYNDETRLWTNDGTGAMTDSAAALGLVDNGSGKGVATLDYDRDGDLDVVGSATNRDGLGAKVRVWSSLNAAPQVREIGVQGHFLGQSERTAHFGMGSAQVAAKVEVTFPASGVVWGQTDVSLRQRIEVHEF